MDPDTGEVVRSFALDELGRLIEAPRRTRPHLPALLPDPLLFDEESFALFRQEMLTVIS
jgi:hypothetical protein